MKLFIDLHIHTALSPCGDNDMTPYNITAMAKLKGLDAIAITDHNCALNVEACEYFGKRQNITVIPGMELNTREEVHVLCLFDTLQKALEFQNIVWAKQNYIKNLPEKFGNQVIFDNEDRISDSVERLLITSTGLSFDDAFKIVRDMGGVFIPAHIDKDLNSVISNLGFIPDDADPISLEYQSEEKLFKLLKSGIIRRDYKFIKSSDAHYLNQILERETNIDVTGNSVKDILDFLKKRQK